MSNRRNVTHYKAEESGDAFAVLVQVKSYGSTGPDPGRMVSEDTYIDGVSREYAEMLARELTKHKMTVSWPEDRNIFDIVSTVSRNVDMWTGSNSENWGEKVAHPIVY